MFVSAGSRFFFFWYFFSAIGGSLLQAANDLDSSHFSSLSLSVGCGSEVVHIFSFMLCSTIEIKNKLILNSCLVGLSRFENDLKQKMSTLVTRVGRLCALFLIQNCIQCMHVYFGVSIKKWSKLHCSGLIFVLLSKHSWVCKISKINISEGSFSLRGNKDNTTKFVCYACKMISFMFSFTNKCI